MMFNKLIDYIADRVIQRIEEQKTKEIAVKRRAVGRVRF